MRSTKTDLPFKYGYKAYIHPALHGSTEPDPGFCYRQKRHEPRLTSDGQGKKKKSTAITLFFFSSLKILCGRLGPDHLCYRVVLL